MITHEDKRQPQPDTGLKSNHIAGAEKMYAGVKKSLGIMAILITANALVSCMYSPMGPGGNYYGPVPSQRAPQGPNYGGNYGPQVRQAPTLEDLRHQNAILQEYQQQAAIIDSMRAMEANQRMQQEQAFMQTFYNLQNIKNAAQNW